MRWQLSSLTAAAVLTGALALPRGASDVPPTSSESLTRQREVARLRAHFDSVDAELRQVSTPSFTPGQRTARATLIGWLREYRDAGEFPRNDRLPDRAMPFFRDSRGVLCAMAYLIERSGRGDLVDRVASTRNNAFIAELADNPALVGWLDSAGLSVAEAARIQPQYGSDVIEDDDPSTEYVATSVVASGASLTTLVLNLTNPSTTSGWAGVAAGSLGVIAGAVNLDRNGGTETLAAADLLIGGVALAAGIYTLLDPPSGRPVDGPSPQSASSGSRLAIGPLVVPTADGPRLGLAMRRTF